MIDIDLNDIAQIVITRRDDLTYRVTLHGRDAVLGEMDGDNLAVRSLAAGAMSDMGVIDRGALQRK